MQNPRGQGVRVLLAACCLFAAASLPASAATIDWTTWSGNFTADPVNGSAQGSLSSLGLTVSYSGELENLFFNYPSWGPASSYVGGNVGNAPPSSGGIIQLYGNTGATDTITFSSPVVDPILAIWSLGSGGISASFGFNASEPFTIEAGGPSNEYGGSAIYVCGTYAVCGNEGNGTVQLNGTFSSITWTNPQPENWYGFTVGAAGVATSPVPEPSTLWLLSGGILGLGSRIRRRLFGK